MSVRIKQGRVYAWDPSREDPRNPLALVVVDIHPFEVIGVDEPIPLLGRGMDWSARYGMLGVEMRGEHLAQYETAVLAGGTEWHRWAEEAEDFGLAALDRLSEVDEYAEEYVDWPSRPGLRLVTFRSVEVLQSYSGWLWSGRGDVLSSL